MTIEKPPFVHRPIGGGPVAASCARNPCSHMCDPRHTSFLSEFDTQLLYNVRADLFLQHVHLLVREGPVHAPIHDAVAAALAAALGMLELVDLRDATGRRPIRGA